MVCYTVEGFKSLFSRGEFPYLPIYRLDETYMKLDECYYEDDGKFYTSKIDYNSGNLPTDTDKWTLTVDNIKDYIVDDDIERAFVEAKGNFNEEIFETCELKTLMFYYLTAHYLCMDWRNATNSLGTSTTFSAQSKSVGNVSVSYAIPQRYLNNPFMLYLSQTGFGNKYASYLIPRMTARCMVVHGRSLP